MLSLYLDRYANSLIHIKNKGLDIIKNKNMYIFQWEKKSFVKRKNGEAKQRKLRG